MNRDDREDPESLRVAYAAALRALRQLCDVPGDVRVRGTLNQASAAVAQLAEGRGAAVLARLVHEIGACHQQGRVYTAELGHAFRAATLTTAD
jgi:hypothetical protein